MLSIPYFQVFHKLPHLYMFFLRCNGAQVYSIVRIEQKRKLMTVHAARLYRYKRIRIVTYFHIDLVYVSNTVSVSYGQLTETIIFTVHHFVAIFKSRNAPNSRIEPRTQHTHILVPGAASGRCDTATWLSAMLCLRG